MSQRSNFGQLGKKGERMERPRPDERPAGSSSGEKGSKP